MSYDYAAWKVKHTFWKLRHWLIVKIAMGDPVLLNLAIKIDNIKEGSTFAYMPGTNQMWDEYEWKDKTVMVPINKLKDKTIHSWKHT